MSDIHMATVRDAFATDPLRVIETVMSCGNAFVYFDSRSTSRLVEEFKDVIGKISDWGGKGQPATKRKLRERFEALGLACESRYDATHGRRYSLCVYPAGDNAARRVTFSAASGLDNTDAEIAKPLVW